MMYSKMFSQALGRLFWPRTRFSIFHGSDLRIHMKTPTRDSTLLWTPSNFHSYITTLLWTELTGLKSCWMFGVKVDKDSVICIAPICCSEYSSAFMLFSANPSEYIQLSRNVALHVTISINEYVVNLKSQQH